MPDEEATKSVSDIQAPAREAIEENPPAEPVPADASPSPEISDEQSEALAGKSEPSSEIIPPVATQGSGGVETVSESPKEPENQESPVPGTAQSGQIEPLAEADGFKTSFSRWIAKGREVIAGKRRKKIEKIMTLFDPSTSLRAGKNRGVTNDDVEKLLHDSDATATRYLSILEQEGKIKQTGKTGHAVSYSKI